MRSYEAARSLFSFLAFVAWAIVAIGVLVAVLGAGGASQYGGSGAALLAMGPGIGVAISGFLLAAFVQMGRANVDTAEYTQQMLKISRDQLEVSKQGLKQHNTAAQSFVAAAQAHSTESLKATFANQPEDAQSSVSAGTAPDQAAIENTVYRGKTIRFDKGKYIYKGIAFDTLEKAKTYVDDFGKVPGKELSATRTTS